MYSYEDLLGWGPGAAGTVACGVRWRVEVGKEAGIVDWDMHFGSFSHFGFFRTVHGILASNTLCSGRINLYASAFLHLCRGGDFAPFVRPFALEFLFPVRQKPRASLSPLFSLIISYLPRSEQKRMLEKGGSDQTFRLLPTLPLRFFFLSFFTILLLVGPKKI